MCHAIYDIYILHIGVKEMGVNLRRKIIFKSRQMVVSYSNSFTPCQNYLTLLLRYNRTNAAVPIHFLSSYILQMTYLPKITLHVTS